MLETGYYFRVERGGKWLNLDIAEMTDEEIFDILKTKDRLWLESLIIGLVDIIRQINNALDDAQIEMKYER